MGRETPRAPINRIRLIALWVIILLFFLTPTGGFSAGQPGDYQKWLETLKKGNANEKIYALSYPPDSLDCCKFQRDPATLNLFLNALKDKNHRIREAAAAFVRMGSHSKKCCQETQMVSALIGALKDTHPGVRGEAVRSLAFLGDKRAVDALISKMDDQDPWVRLNVAFALGEVGGVRAVDPLLKLLDDNSDWRSKFIQQECVISIRKIESQEAFHKKGSIARLAGTLQGARAVQQARQKALETGTGIVGLDDQVAARVILALLRKFDGPYLKMEIIGAMMDFKVLGAREALIGATQDSNDGIRELAIRALLELSMWLREMIHPTPSGTRMDDPNVEVFIKGLNDPAIKVRLQCIEALGRLSDRRAVVPLIELCKDPEVEIRAKAIEALGRLTDSRAIEPLIEASQERDERVRGKAIAALGHFADERILDAAVKIIMNDPRGNLHTSAEATFVSIAKKTAKERAFVYRRNGIRCVSKKRSEIPWGLKVSERLVYPAAVGKLIDLIDHSHDKGKLSAFHLFRQFEDPRIEGVLLKHFDHPSPKVRGEAISLISDFAGNSVVPRLIMASKDKDRNVRVKAVRALGEFQDQRALDPLIGGLSDDEPEVRAAALDSLKSYDDPRLSDLVMERLKDESLFVRRTAVLNIKERRDRKAVEAVSLLLADTDNAIVKYSVEALEAIGDRRATDPLIKALNGEFNRNRDLDGDAVLRRMAARALGSLKDPSAVPALIECLSEEDRWLRGLTVSALEKIGDPAGLEAAKRFQKDKLPPEIRSATPMRPADVRRLPPEMAKEHSGRPGYSVMHFERPKPMGEDSRTKEEKPIDLLPFYQTKIVGKTDLEPKASSDINRSIAKLKSRDSRIRREGADILGDMDNQEATGHLIPLLKDRNEYVRQAAARALGKLKDHRAAEPLIGSLKDPDIHVRAFSTWALGEIRDPRAIEPLASLLLDQEEKISGQSFDALRKFRDPLARKVMVNTLKDGATKGKPGSDLMLRRLTSLEGKDVISKASGSQP